MLLSAIRHVFGSSRFFMSLMIMLLSLCGIDPVTFGTMCATVGGWMFFESQRKS